MVKKILVDVNLPFHFSHWNQKEYLHQREINPKNSDNAIWEYAKVHNLTIITKDVDFANRINPSNPSAQSHSF
jgi:predicted nuclease of predicted toxin-antitoxin system